MLRRIVVPALAVTSLLLLLAPAALPRQGPGPVVAPGGDAGWWPIRVTPDDVFGLVQPDGSLVSAREIRPEVVELAVILGTGVSFEAVVDRAVGMATIRLVDQAGEPHPVEVSDLRLLVRAGRALTTSPQVNAQPAADPLLRLLDWVGDAPPGMVLDLRVPLLQTKAYKSLCRKIDKRVRARWDHLTGNDAGRFRLGPCAQGSCFGRCGQGCGGVPGPGYAVQQFTQDCLNHDACVGALGYASPSCQDEFADTADDVLTAPDCNAIEGTWEINYRTSPDATDRELLFTMRRAGKFTGESHVAEGRYVTFKGKREDPPPMLKRAKLRLPLWMPGSCNSTPLGFAQATIRGTNYCGVIRGRLQNGTWNRHRNCRPDGTEPWTGKVVLERTSW